MELLQAMNFHQFLPTVQSCRIDGITLLCVASDWDCLCRLKKYLPTSQIQEINFVSQVLLAENYFVRYFREEEDISPTSAKALTQPEVKIVVNRNLK